jgi:hypothetical protein
MGADDDVEGEEILHCKSSTWKAEEQARVQREAEESARAEEAREEARFREAEVQFIASMEPVFKTCTAIHTALLDLLPAINLLRYSAVDGPHTSHRSLVEYTYERARSPAYINVPAFLRLVDECVTSSEELNVERCSNAFLCPYSPEQARRKFTVIGKLAYSTWVQYGRLVDGRDGHDGNAKTTDDEVVKCERRKEEARFFIQCNAAHADFDFESWLKQPGRWLPQKEYASYL